MPESAGSEEQHQPDQSPLRGLCEAVHGVAIGVWGGVLLMVGVTAAVTFPMMADLDVQVPRYSGFEGEHHRLAAGQVMNKAFAISDWLGLGCLLIAAGCLSAMWGANRSGFRRMRVGLVLRLASIGVLAVLTLFQTLAFRPHLNNAFDELWIAAEAGENERAEQIRQSLAPRHAKASFLLTTQFALVLVVGLAAGYDAATFRPSDAGGGRNES